MLFRNIALAAVMAALPAFAFAQTAPDRYTVKVSVLSEGVEVAAGRTVMVEGGQAEILLTGADGQYSFTADLQPEQGDGDETRLVLEAYLNHDGADLAHPTMVLTRGARAIAQMGSKAEGARTLTSGVEIELTPLTAPEPAP
jgi:hypothetical protein